MKRLSIIGIFGIFCLCIATHFIYDIFPSTFTAIFFPVNESIWEHMKMIFTTILLYHGLEYLYIYFKKITIPNFSIATFISAILAIPIYLTLFLPLYYHIGEHMTITLSLLLIVIAITQYINYKITTYKDIPYECIFAITGIIITYIILGYLTYNPPKTHLFFDTEHEKYGINHYNI